MPTTPCRRTWSILVLAVILIGCVGCGLGRRVTGAPQPAASPTASETRSRVTVRFVTAAGFPLRAGVLAPSLVAAYERDGVPRIAPPGQHFVTVAVTVSNPTTDRPAPFAIRNALPLTFLAVPVADAAALGLQCPAVPGLEQSFPAANWCPLRVMTGSSQFGGSPLSASLLSPGAVVTDYFYTDTPLPDAALDRLSLEGWALALQTGLTSFVGVRSGPGSSSTPPSAPGTPTPGSSGQG